MTTSDVEGAKQTSFEFVSSRTVLQALQALSTNAKQVIRVTVTSTGVQFRCEDDGKVSQSSVRFPRSFFSAFNFSGVPSTFSVQLSALADALRVFAALPDVAVIITETQDHLVLETAETDGTTTASMYAHLTILGTNHIVDILDHWQPPATEFLASTALLREAVEDLEWPQGHVRVLVQAQPLQVSFVGRGSVGCLDVVLPSTQLRNAKTQEASIQHFYPYKFMKAALSGIVGHKGELSTQVSIDANGMLKVVHMLPAGRGGAADAASQGTQAVSNDVVLSYAIQPMFDDEMEQGAAYDL